MCGILGGIWFNKFELDGVKINEALSKLNHRGPDDFGYIVEKIDTSTVILGHTRLSILDLSAAGHQPMISDDEIYHLVFNGEIYNFKELRIELESHGVEFKTNTDTEVLLQSWIRWGEDSLIKFEGMFSFVILNKLTKKVFCARDAFGIKPFFYILNDDYFIFASEVAAIQDLIDTELSINPQRCYDYLVHADYDGTAHSFFKGINHLLPANCIEVDLNNNKLVSVKRWWSPSITENKEISFEDATTTVRKNFLDSVRKHLRSDVPIGAALSGGIDSSAIVCAMRYLEPQLTINTFSYIAEDESISEEKWVDLINQHTNAKAHKVFSCSNELASNLDKMIIAQGEPFSTTSIFAQYKVFETAREAGVVVTLDGQGADELHAGYIGYPGQRVKSLVETGKFLSAIKFIYKWSLWPGRKIQDVIMYFLQAITPIFLNDLARKVTGKKITPDWLIIDSLLSEGVTLKEPTYVGRDSGNGRSVIRQLKSSIQNRGLVGLLRHADRNSMLFSLESRVPFLTIKQAEYLFSLPESYLISKEGESKSVLRAALKGIVPDEVLNRKDKIGFATPEADWLRAQSDLIDVWLREGCYPSFINKDRVIQEFELFKNGNSNNWKQVWRWVNFIRWFNVCVKNK